MICKNCGNEVNKEQKYCSKCGEKICFDKFVISQKAIIFICSIAAIAFLLVSPKLYTTASEYKYYLDNVKNKDITLIYDFSDYENSIDYFKKLAKYTKLALKYGNLTKEDKLKIFKNYREYINTIAQNSDSFYVYQGETIEQGDEQRENYCKQIIDSDINYQDFKCCLAGDGAYNQLLNFRKAFEKTGLYPSTYFGINFFFVEDSEFLYNTFSKYLPEDWQEFLKIRSQEKLPYMGDGSSVLKPSVLGDRIARWEGFIKKYPYWDNSKEVHLLLHDYSEEYVWGKYHKLYISDTQYRLDKKWVDEYNRYIFKYPDSKFVPFLQKIISNPDKFANSLYKIDWYPYLKAYYEQFPEEEPYFEMPVQQKTQKEDTDIDEQNNSYIYSISTKIWKIKQANQIINQDEIELKENPPEGSMGYTTFSVIRKDNQSQEIFSPSDVPIVFIKNNNLYYLGITENKFYSVNFENNNFQSKELSINEVKQLFPDYEIITCADRKNDIINFNHSSKNKYMLLSCSYNTKYMFSSDDPTFSKEKFNNTFSIKNKNAWVLFAPFGSEQDCDEYEKCLYIHIN